MIDPKLDDLNRVNSAIWKLDVTMASRRIGGINPWFYSRVIVWQWLQSAILDTENAHSVSVKVSVSALANYVCQSLFRLPYFWARRNSVFIFSSGVVVIPDNQRYINRLYDRFVLRGKNKTTLIEDAVAKGYRRPRWIRRYANNDGLRVIAVILGRLMGVPPQHKGSVRRFVNEVMRFLQSYGFQTDALGDVLQSHLEGRLSGSRFGIRLYRLLYTIKRPELVVAEDACYGSRLMELRACRSMGIPTAEVQHGNVSSNHLAYNLSQAAPLKLYALEYPDALFLLSEYYTKKTNVPSMTRTVGSPHINRVISGANGKRVTSPTEADRTILFVTQGTLSRVFDNFIDEYAELKPLGWQIVHKPHPGEDADYSLRYPKLAGRNDVERSGSVVYDLLSQVSVVVGAYSTVLFEAIGFGHHPIVIDHILTRANIDVADFHIVEKPTDLTKDLLETVAMTADRRGKPFWPENPIERWDQAIVDITQGGSE